MKKSKKIISSLLLSTTFACMGGSAFLLTDNNFDNHMAMAENTSYEQITNSLPDYFKVTKESDTLNKIGDEIFLFNSLSEKINIRIADTLITSKKQNGQPVQNYGYYPVENGEIDSDTYYFYKFSNSLSLYYDLSNSEFDQAEQSVNLLEGKSISLFTKQYTGEDGGAPNNLDFTPQQLDISFALGTSFEVQENSITLANQGCYTLSLPIVIYQTTNNGQSFISREEVINYSFMALSFSTYFNSATGNPNISPSSNMQTTSLQGAGYYSKYYYHSYNANKNENGFTLPTLSFNPNNYQFTISYTDTNQKIKTTRIEYTNTFTQYDENGNIIPEKDYFVWTQGGDNSAKLVFNDLGTYDIQISYLYKSASGKIYSLPLDKLSSDKINNKLQRVYIYGVQSFYSNYDQIDTATHQPISCELKTLDKANATFSDSADITMAINKTLEESSNNPTTNKPANNLLDYALSYINNTPNVTPASTNQTPIKFVNNVKIDSSTSGLYSLTKNDRDVWVATEQTFSLLNQNNAGTYLYILKYTFDEFMSPSAVPQTKDYHYQVFFFEITNTAPSVSLFKENVNLESGEVTTAPLYTRGYTNKSVYIIDNSSQNPYDANVEITLTAIDYISGRTLIDNQNIKSLTTYGIEYKTFEEGSPLSGQSGLRISNQEYKNAKFTIKIKASNLTKPSITTFTIDNIEIQNISARQVFETNSTNFSIGEQIPQNFSNQPLVFSWDKKESGAPTYGYLKYLPLENYTHNTHDAESAYLAVLIEKGILPVNYKFDMSSLKDTSWVEYRNTYDYNSVVNASFVKQNSGFYILEVYDEAGNTGIEIFLIDKTTPLFVKNLQSLDSTGQIESEIRSLMANGENIDVPEETNYKISIEWADKGIWLDNFDVFGNISDFTAFAYSEDKENADKVLQNKLKEFFNAEQTYIGILNGAFVQSGTYLTIQVNPTYYALSEDGNRYQANTGNSYQVKLFEEDSNGDIQAVEMSHSILIRDISNTKVYGDEATNYKNAPSGMLNFRVTSDASKLDIKVGDKPESGVWTALQWANYSFTGNLTKENQPADYGTDQKEITTNKYKYSYILPTNDSQKLSLTYIPLPSNGSVVEKITLKYYPYQKASLQAKSYKSGSDESADESNNVLNTYFYYTLAKDPSKQYDIYTDGSISITKGEERVFEIVLGTTNFPAEGRYVFERTFKTENSVGKFDYLKRTISFIVDPYNVISPIESTDDGENTSLESVVGGDILVSMYAGAGNENIEISFPKYSNGLNQGSFYTQSSFNELESFPDSQISVVGNKLPLSLLIPQFKYTTHTIKNNTNSYKVTDNDNLTYYAMSYVEGNDVDGYKVYRENILIGIYSTREEADNARISADAGIQVYSLYAKVDYFPEGSTTQSERYHGGNIDTLLGKSNTYSNGYMHFYKQTSSLSAQSEKLTLEETPTANFTKPGKYVVSLYQANNRGASFQQLYSLYKFAFKIESTSPEFDIVDNAGYTLESKEDNSYFTNSPKLTIQWQIPSSEYIAKIDETKIILASNQAITKGEIKGDKTAGGTRYFEIDTTNILTALLHDSNTPQFIDITMFFEGHKDNIYKQTTKRIYFDITAPHTNLSLLISNVASSSLFKGISPTLDTSMLQSYTREYYDYKGNAVQFNQYGENGNGISYSYVKNSGLFKYYYFNVQRSFIDSLTVQEDRYGTKEIYQRQIDNLATYTPADRTSFNANNYGEVQDIELGLYEIVELDWAGNMCVYIINVVSVNDDDTLLEYKNKKSEETEEGASIQFTYGEMAVNGGNLYSGTGFTITSMNFHNDDWTMFALTKAGGVANVYMTSPWLGENEIYMLDGLSFETTSISSLFSGLGSSNRKHLIKFANREIGQTSNLYITIYNATLITSTSFTSPNAQLDIVIPSKENLESTTYGYVYPVAVKVEILERAGYKVVAEAKLLKGLYQEWQKDNDLSNAVTISISDGKFSLKTQIADVGNKIKYTITDNFGNVSRVVQLANITAYTEIEGEGGVYKVIESDASETYVSEKPITFNYHPTLYTIQVLDDKGVEAIKGRDYTEAPRGKLNSLTFSQENSSYTILVYDADEGRTPLKTLHIRLYNKLPAFTEKVEDLATISGVAFLDRNLTPFEEEQTQTKILHQTISVAGRTFANPQTTYISTYSSVVTMRYANSPAENGEDNYYLKNFTYSAYISSDNGRTFIKLDIQDGALSSHVIRGKGDYLIFFVYDDENVLTRSYRAYALTIWDSTASYYSITIDGVKVERCNLTYTSPDFVTYEVNYLVGVDYSNRNRVVVTANEELGVTITPPSAPITTGTNVYVELYSYSCKESRGSFAIIYIKPNNDFTNQFSYEAPSGASESLLGKQNEMVVAKETDTSFDRLKLTFTPYYGIASNRIHLKVEKMFEGNFVDVSPEIDYTQTVATAYITRAGYYRISLHDSCEPANYQTFKGSNYMYLYFLNSIPFVVTSENSEGNKITTEAINNAIYNSSVTLSLTNLNAFYEPSAYPQITVYRNNRVYTRDNGNGQGYIEKNYSFTFSQAGYYQITFSAMSAKDKNQNSYQIRTTTFSFMIISKNEARSAFDYPAYASYYIAKIEKLGLGDITADFIKFGSSDDIIQIQGKDYLSALSLSYLDEKTGEGRYTITLCPNEPAYESVGVKAFTFDLWIHHALPPLNISIDQGEATTDNITITFNVQNFYDAVGDSYIKIGSSVYYFNESTLSSYEDIEKITISRTGTHYIQVFTASGQLIYSYKVVKNEPLNAFAIIAIVVGVIALITIIVITIRLRKRQRVK